MSVVLDTCLQLMGIVEIFLKFHQSIPEICECFLDHLASVYSKVELSNSWSYKQYKYEEHNSCHDPAVWKLYPRGNAVWQDDLA